MTANRLLRGGVRVYLYPAMTHVKAMSVDGTSGLHRHRQLRRAEPAEQPRGLASPCAGPSSIRQIDEDLFLRDMAVSEELTGPLAPPRNRLLLKATLLLY